ncbi:hypothetical protein [Lactiplantibacillus paraxiangfangensis]|uniref:hypothetical protein n=1 Tax=Lactiplantibacillus paraxiangfangensis TaxID=3076224 RepID=UPI0030C69F25
MKLVHFVQHLVLTVSKNKKYHVRASQKKGHRIMLEHTNTFASEDTTGTVEVTIHNLTMAHIKEFKVGRTVTLDAGWYDISGNNYDVHRVISAKISFVSPSHYTDADTAVQFTITVNQQYDNIKPIKVRKSKRVRIKASQKSLDKAISAYNSKINKQRKKWIDEHPHAKQKEVTAQNKHWTKLKKNYATNARSNYNKKRKQLNDKKQYQVKTVHEYMSFKKGTHGSTIIKRIAKQAGIKLKAVHLNYDRVYLNGYTAKSKPMTCIKQIAKDCDTEIINSYGDLRIEKLDTKRKRNIHIQPSTGLISTEYQSGDDNKNSHQWQVTFLYRSVAVGDIIYLNSTAQGGPNGWVIILSGNSSYTGNGTPTTQVTVELYSTYRTKVKKKVNKKKLADRKAKAKADEKSKKKAQAKRKARQKAKSKTKTKAKSKKK